MPLSPNTHAIIPHKVAYRRPAAVDVKWARRVAPVAPRTVGSRNPADSIRSSSNRFLPSWGIALTEQMMEQAWAALSKLGITPRNVLSSEEHQYQARVEFIKAWLTSK